MDEACFIFGPEYRAAQCKRVSLVNFLIGQATMSIWLTRRNTIKQTGSVDLESMFRGLVAGRVKIEFAYYKIISDLEEFMGIWGLGGVLCTVYQEALVMCV